MDTAPPPPGDFPGSPSPYSEISPAEQAQILTLQQSLLEAVTQGHDHHELLIRICLLAEQLLPDAVATVTLLDGQGRLKVYAAPSVPPEGVARLNGLRPGPGAGSCGNAIYRAEPVFVCDTRNDPRWADLRSLALDFDVKACWSMPVRGAGGRVLGSFALSSFEHRAPSAFHRRLLEIGASIIGIILERRDQLEALRASEERLRLVLKGTGDSWWDWDLVRNVIYYSPQWWRMIGLEPDAQSADPDLWHRRLHPDDCAAADALLAALQTDSEVLVSLELRLRHERGHYVPVLARGFVLRDTAGRPTRLSGVNIDLTTQKQVEERLRLATRVFDSASESILVTDADNCIVLVNGAFTATTGYEASEVIGRSARSLRSPRHDAAFHAALWDTLRATGQWQGEIWSRRKDGGEYPEWLTVSRVTDDRGETTHYVAISTDITAIKQSEERLDFLANYDSLTHLPNRALFHDRLLQGLRRAQRHGTGLAVLLVDLDRFKTVNDALGRSVGDQLLLAAAQRMAASIRTGDTLARLSGDEFVLLLEGPVNAHTAASAARDLVGLFREPLQVGTHVQYLTPSIGISLYPGDGEDPESLVKHADMAMSEVKNRGRNGFQFFEPALTAGVSERLLLENALYAAVARQELRLHYQPQIDLVTGALVGVEALVRWEHPELGLILPGRFIPLAEELGIISSIGAWVLREACRQMVAWEHRGFFVPHMAVNLSVQQIEREALVDLVMECLTEAGLEPCRLGLEVTESLVMRAPEQAQVTLTRLQALGVTLAMDDFGTGYSSLAYLKRLPLKRLKIDQSFIQEIGRSAHDDAIIRAIISIGRSLGLELVAEGVERQDQAALLVQEGCWAAQGYLFSPPVTAATLEEAWQTGVPPRPPAGPVSDVTPSD